MPAPRNIFYNESMESLWAESSYTFAALSSHSLTLHLTAPQKLLLDGVEEVWKGQRACWLGEQVAQSQCNQTNYELDLLTEEFHRAKVGELRAKNKGWKDKEARSSPEFKVYFGTLPPSSLIRLALENQAPLMETWPQKLQEEASPDLQGYAARFKELLEKANAALKAREEARAKTALHRLKTIHPLIDKLNDARLGFYGDLIQIARREEEAKSWPETFFVKREPSSPNREEARAKGQALLLVLASRQVSVSEDEQRKILSASDPQLVERWLSKAVTTPDVASLFAL